MLALHVPLIHHCFWALCQCYTELVSYPICNLKATDPMPLQLSRGNFGQLYKSGTLPTTKQRLFPHPFPPFIAFLPKCCYNLQRTFLNSFPFSWPFGPMLSIMSHMDPLGGFHIWPLQDIWIFWPLPSVRNIYLNTVSPQIVGYFLPSPSLSFMCGRHIWKPP